MLYIILPTKVSVTMRRTNQIQHLQDLLVCSARRSVSVANLVVFFSANSFDFSNVMVSFLMISLAANDCSFSDLVKDIISSATCS